MNGTIELKPCPFCGSPARMTVYGTDYLAECTFCDASACTGDTEERAAAVWNNRADAKYELGQFDERAYRHGRNVVDEMREATGVNKGVAHFVCVAVYVDGYLQFAGADACLEKYGNPIDRLAAKNDAAIILGRMNPDGGISRGGAM